MAANPQFTGAVNLGLAHMTAANTNRDGSGTLYDLVTGGANGTRVDKIIFHAEGTTVAGMVRILLYDTANNRLVNEILVTAITASGTVAAWHNDHTPPGGFYLVPAGYKLKVSLHDATVPVNVMALGGDF